jgi:hypothetical protein
LKLFGINAKNTPKILKCDKLKKVQYDYASVFLFDNFDVAALEKCMTISTVLTSGFPSLHYFALPLCKYCTAVVFIFIRVVSLIAFILKLFGFAY